MCRIYSSDALFKTPQQSETEIFSRFVMRASSTGVKLCKRVCVSLPADVCWWRRVQYQFPDFSRYHAVISATGKVFWEPAGVFETSCKIDITFYPYDTQVRWADNVYLNDRWCRILRHRWIKRANDTRYTLLWREHFELPEAAWNFLLDIPQHIKLLQ